MATAICQTDCEASPAAPGKIATILVVDDMAFDLRLVSKVLESVDGLRLLYARNGREALAIIERDSPTAVLTDMIMPEMNGLELVYEIRSLYPHIPVVLMTASGSEDIAMEALRAGAINYIPKKHLMRDLVQTIRKVIAMAKTRRERARVLSFLDRRESSFVLENNPDLLDPLVALVNEDLEGMDTMDATRRMQTCVALQESLINALFHGNLEVSSDLRQENENEFYSQAQERCAQTPYRGRKIRFQSQIDHEAARFLVADDGPGFDVAIMNRTIEPEHLTRIGGRGLLLIRTFMDQVTFNKIGNEITMVKLGSASIRGGQSS
jgi:CheY-like chemotaxis protein